MQLTLSVFLFQPVEDVTPCTQRGQPVRVCSHQYDDCNSLKNYTSEVFLIVRKKTNVTVWLTDVFFGQQWSSLPQRGKLRQALTAHRILFWIN